MTSALAGLLTGVVGALLWAGFILAVARARSVRDPKRTTVFWMAGLLVVSTALAFLFPALAVLNAGWVAVGYALVIGLLWLRWIGLKNRNPALG